MSVRIILALLVTCLVMAGCASKSARRGAATAHSVESVPQQPVNLRGPLDAQIITEPLPAQTVIQEPAPAITRRARPPVIQATYGDENAPYLLDSGDKLRIVVFGQENLSRTYAVDGGGYISMPLIGAVLARGTTTFSLEKTIASKLRAGFVKDPKVTVEIQDYRPFFILGEVRRPGQFPYVNGMNIQTAVAIAGGYTERARERKMKLTRRTNGHDVTIWVPDNYLVRPGDTIYVTERIF